MHPIADLLVKLLPQVGWSVARKEVPDAWWADECWHLDAAGDSAVLTFLADPQADSHRRKKGEAIWAVKASAALPLKWQRGEGEIVLDLGKKWADRATGFVQDLDRFRKEVPIQSPQTTPRGCAPRRV
jgi:hypothetical protein